MAVSETYLAKASAEHAVDVVKAEAASAPVIDISDGTTFARNLP